MLGPSIADLPDPHPAWAEDERIFGPFAYDEGERISGQKGGSKSDYVIMAFAEQLALAAYRISPTADAGSALLDATAAGVLELDITGAET